MFKVVSVFNNTSEATNVDEKSVDHESIILSSNSDEEMDKMIAIEFELVK